jgi:hypothetical protein
VPVLQVTGRPVRIPPAVLLEPIRAMRVDALNYSVCGGCANRLGHAGTLSGPRYLAACADILSAWCNRLVVGT